MPPVARLMLFLPVVDIASTEKPSIRQHKQPRNNNEANEMLFIPKLSGGRVFGAGEAGGLHRNENLELKMRRNKTVWFANRCPCCHQPYLQQKGVRYLAVELTHSGRMSGSQSSSEVRLVMSLPAIRMPKSGP